MIRHPEQMTRAATQKRRHFGNDPDDIRRCPASKVPMHLDDALKNMYEMP
jgi:hypothetical protein